MMTRVWPVADEGLGNGSYLAEVGDGAGLVVDPGRDPRPYLRLAAANGLRITFAADTHVHADFVSGGRELAGLGARLLAPAGSGLAFGHEELRDGHDLDLGGLTLRALATPGHTPEHLSYLLLDGMAPAAVFTGGALIVGGVARTDLADPAAAEAWTRAAYRSARGLLDLPDGLPVYPTHGPGSFCSAGEAGERTTTIGQEKAANPLLAGPGEDAFTASLLARLGSYPAYFRRMPAVNRRGAPRHGPTRPVLAKLTAAHLAELAAAGATIVDARPIEAFAAGHVPGSLSNALRPAFATWLGWLADPQQPLVVVLDDGQDRGELVEACLKVGYDNLTGELDGGITTWQAAGLATASIPLTDANDAACGGRQVLDVRQDSEWAAGHLPGAVHRELGTLASPSPATWLPGGPLAVMCGHGERAMTGASLLAAAGAGGLSVLRGGPDDWAKATGQQLDQR
jgi:glyoxylase-like metal-dependent hydrolase (beta-lactamase superfamily II)/rhodanese-related sulfurtransferase